LNDDPVISLDNQQTIRLITSEAPRLVTKLKHVDIHQLWLRQEFQFGKIKVEWVPTAEMVADGFTKELSPQKHSVFVRQLGMEDIRSRLQNQKNRINEPTV
ncbi:Reverse transcriptase family protein, partial [Thalictrum thalictroides]